MKEKLSFLRDELKRNHLHFKWQNPHLSLLEGIFSRGDRALSHVLIRANQLGCRFDGWSDQFNSSLWEKAFEKAGVEMGLYVRDKGFEEPLPWSFIETGIKPGFLREELQRSLREEITHPCVAEGCYRCGICNGKTIRVKESLPNEIGSPQQIEKKGIPRQKVRQKIRLRFTKRGETRFLSHLELAQLFHRASKRADLPLCHSEGFHPLPRIVFAGALPVGMESLKEIVDMELEGRLTSLEVMESLNRVLPQGIEITEAEEVALSSMPSSLTHRSVYWIPLDHLLSKEEVVTKIKKVLEKREFIIRQERKEKRRSVDVRPLIERMEVRDNGMTSEKGHNWGIEMVLRNEGTRTAKPSEIIGTLFDLKGEALSQCKVVKIE
jgi:radical SAM-linked protein